MRSIKEILMTRDGLTERDAEEVIADVREQIACAQDIIEVEEILMYDLGLEMDYIDQLI